MCTNAPEIFVLNKQLYICIYTNAARRTQLEDVALVLLLVDIEVSPHSDTRETQDKKASGRDGTIHLALTPGVVDSVATIRAKRVHDLFEVAIHIDLEGLVLEVVG